MTALTFALGDRLVSKHLEQFGVICRMDTMTAGTVAGDRVVAVRGNKGPTGNLMAILAELTLLFHQQAFNR